MRFPFFALLAFLPAPLGCGPDVAGRGGSTASGGATGDGGVSPSGGSSGDGGAGGEGEEGGAGGEAGAGGGVVSPDPCPTVCATCNDDADCLPSCESEIHGACAESAAAFFDCHAQNLDPETCLYIEPLACDALLSAFQTCASQMGPACVFEPCGNAADGSCECSGYCHQLPVHAACTAPNELGVVDCECSYGGETASCTGSSLVACDLMVGCCASALMLGGP